MHIKLTIVTMWGYSSVALNTPVLPGAQKPCPLQTNTVPKL